MEKLDALLNGKQPPAVYRLMSRAATKNITATVEAHGWRCFALDGKQIENKASFLENCATVMHFPAYASRNWDAFEECLSDLSWVAGPGYILLYDDVENFARQAPQEWSVAFDILSEAVSRWQKLGVPFIVLLRKTGNSVRGLPKI